MLVPASPVLQSKSRKKQCNCTSGFAREAVCCGMTNKFKKPISERKDEAMVRLCLKCREAFESHWAGERVCKTCKSRDEWRTGGGYEAA